MSVATLDQPKLTFVNPDRIRTLRIDDNTWSALDTLAEDLDINRTDVIRLAIHEYLRRHKVEVAEPLLVSRGRRGEGRRDRR